MATTPTTRASEPRRASLAAGLSACALVTVSAAYAEVNFEPSISVGVARTDNLTLVSEDQEAQTVYEVIPSFKLTQKSPRVAANAFYRPEGYWYSERGAHDVFHVLDGNLRVAPDPDNFFLDLGASREQTIGDPAAAIARSNLPISTNRLNRDQAFFGPSFAYPLGRDVTANGSLRRSWVRYNEPDTTTITTNFGQDYQEDTTSFSLDNYRKGRGFTWATRLGTSKTEYDLYPDYEYRNAAVELGAWAGNHVRVFGSGGKESAWDKPFDPSLADDFWEVGFATRTGQRITAELAAGERSFGSSRRGVLKLTFGHGSVQIEHSDQPTTQTPDRYRTARIPPAPGVGPSGSSGTQLPVPETPIDLLTQPSSAERYLSRLSRATLSFDLQRTTLLMAAFDESREDRVRLDNTPLPDEDQTGFTLSASHRFGTRTELILAFGKSRSGQFEINGRDLESTTLTANHDLGSRTRLSLEYQHSSEDSHGASSNFDYTAQLVSVFVTRTFNRGVRK